MFRTKYVAIEFQDFSYDVRRLVDEIAGEFGLGVGRQLRNAEEYGQYAVRIFPVGRSRRSAEAKVDEVADYLQQATSLPASAYVYPPRLQCWRFLRTLPFKRCQCGRFTRILWRERDPHYRYGRWLGPDNCLPF